MGLLDLDRHSFATDTAASSCVTPQGESREAVTRDAARAPAPRLPPPRNYAFP